MAKGNRTAATRPNQPRPQTATTSQGPENASAVRADILNRGVAALMTINGGAAAAVLAFCGSVAETQPGLAIAMLDGLIRFSWGVVAAALIYFVRFARAFFTDSLAKSPKADIYTLLWGVLAALSLLMFFLGTQEISDDGRAALMPSEVTNDNTPTPPSPEPSPDPIPQ